MEAKYLIDNKTFEIQLVDNSEIAAYISGIFNKDGVLEIEHTSTNPIYRGQGLAKQLVELTIKYAKENKIKIIPVCSYVVSYFQKNSNEVKDIIQNLY